MGITIWNDTFLDVMFSDIMREELEALPVDLMNFLHNQENQTYVRQKSRPLLKQLAKLPHHDVLDHLVKLQCNIKIKTIKEEGDDGYDSDITADLTSDDSSEEESLQIYYANTQYKYGHDTVSGKGRTSKRMDLESVRGCYTGKISGTRSALDYVEQLNRPALYSRKSNVPKF